MKAHEWPLILNFTVELKHPQPEVFKSARLMVDKISILCKGSEEK
jgi:hypothetical protein